MSRMGIIQRTNTKQVGLKLTGQRPIVPVHHGHPTHTCLDRLAGIRGEYR